MSPADTAPPPSDTDSESSRQEFVRIRRKVRLVFDVVVLAVFAGLIPMCTAEAPPARAWVGNAKSGLVYDSPDAWLPLIAWTVSPTPNRGGGYEVRRRLGFGCWPDAYYRLIIQPADGSGRAELRAYDGHGAWLDRLEPSEALAGTWLEENGERGYTLRADGVIDDSEGNPDRVESEWWVWVAAAPDVILIMSRSCPMDEDEGWSISASWVISADGRTARSDTNRVFHRTER